MSDIYLLGQIGQQHIAVAAGAIDAVVDVTTVTPVPRAPAHLLGLCAIRSDVVTLIDCGLAVGDRPCGVKGRAVVTTIDGTRYAMRLDAVEGVATHVARDDLSGMPLARAWRHVAIGRIDLAGRLVLVVDPARLILPDDHAAAA